MANRRQPKCVIYMENGIPASKARRWRWRLIAGNGRIIADGGEGYSSKGKARDGFIRAMNLGEVASIQYAR